MEYSALRLELPMTRMGFALVVTTLGAVVVDSGAGTGGTGYFAVRLAHMTPQGRV